MTAIGVTLLQCDADEIHRFDIKEFRKSAFAESDEKGGQVGGRNPKRGFTTDRPVI